MPEFETFRKRTPRLVSQPYVTIQKKGTIGFNRAAFDAIGGPAAVELLYAPDERIVGIRAVGDDIEHGYPIRTAAAKRESSFLISGIAFCNYYGIDTTVARRWAAHMEDGVLCINLNDDFTEVTSNRNRRAHPTAADQEAEEVSPS